MRACRIAPAGSFADPADTVVLDHDGRRRRRIALTGQGGLAFLLDLAEVPALRNGDGLVLDDGRIVAVLAAAEPLIEAHASDPEHLARLAWHVGNRHLAAEIGEGTLRLRADHVIADMLRGLGAEVAEVTAPFEPEGGAYAGNGPAHGPADGPAHGHAHSRSRSHG
jgi:urease accessory protein